MTQEQAIEKGAIVRLKSGGPPMAVRSVSGDQAYCEWFTETERRQGTFILETLVVVDEPPPPAST